MNAIVMNHTKKDEAVSPVVGVMLMLVVTIIIAAVVAMFASNVMSETEMSPISMLKVNVSDDPDKEGLDSIAITVYGGDEIDLSKIQVFATYDDGEMGVKFKKPVGDSRIKTLLSVGEKVNIVKEGVSVMEPIGFDDVDEALEALAEQELIHVMIVFNESTILYDKDLRVTN